MFHIFEPFIMLLLLIVTGAVLNLTEVLDLALARQLSRLIVRITFPAMLFTSMYNNITWEVFSQGWIFTLIALFTSIILAITAHIFGKKLVLDQQSFSTFQILCTNGNNIFLPVPIIGVLYGPQYVVYAVLFELGAGIFYWTYGVSHFRQGARFDPRRLINQNILALLLGLAVGLTGLGLPQFLVGALDIIGSITLGAALLILGSLSAQLFKGGFSCRREVIGVICHRLLVSPLIGLIFLPFLGLSSQLKTILLLMLAMPPLVTTALVAVNFNADEELATLGVVLPTLLSLVAIPLLLHFFN